LRDQDPEVYVEEVRYAAHIEARQRVAALVDVELERA
jgi:hypothetical protein